MEPETIKFKLHYSSAYKKRLIIDLSIMGAGVLFLLIGTIIYSPWSHLIIPCFLLVLYLFRILELPLTVTADTEGITARCVIGKTKIKRSEIVSIQPLSDFDGSVQLKWWYGYKVRIGGKTLLPVPAFVTDDKHIAVVTVKRPKSTAYQYGISCPDEATLAQLCQWGNERS